ncbi:ATP11-domain-containing protein [Scleroderma citrinum]
MTVFAITSRAHLTLRCLSRVRWVHSRVEPSVYDLKYADKLHQKAKEKGISLGDLKVQAQQEVHRKQAGAAVDSSLKYKTLPDGRGNIRSSTSSESLSTRKDSSPIKPLSSILNIPKLLATPHTPAQISSLWTAYHASRSGNTGRGFICASLSLEAYNTMMTVAKKYPVFILPVPRQAESVALSEGDALETANEFYFLQWDFHPPPPQPSAVEPDPFQRDTSSSGDNALPQVSTVLFTPLQEYKLHNSFATPYFVLTFYTDLSSSHGLVLLRGEITPSAAIAVPEKVQDTTGRYLLSQVDAQLLAMGIQKFYLWGERKGAGACDSAAEDLLRQFHEKPQEFDWQELLKHSSIAA